MHSHEQIFILSIKVGGSLCMRGAEELQFFINKGYAKENEEGNYKCEYAQWNHSETSKLKPLQCINQQQEEKTESRRINKSCAVGWETPTWTLMCFRTTP